MKLQPFTESNAPHFHSLVASASDCCDAIWKIQHAAVRVIRGTKSRTVDCFFDESVPALQFPFYFGGNWDAFSDCLQDLRWIDAPAIVIVFTDAVELLVKAPKSQQKVFVQVLQDAVEYWNRPKKPGFGKAFHVIFHANYDDELAMLNTWQTLGIEMNRLI